MAKLLGHCIATTGRERYGERYGEHLWRDSTTSGLAMRRSG
jgi:hypothetical protein